MQIEIQQIRKELESREREISQILKDTDLAEMETELHFLRQQVSMV